MLRDNILGPERFDYAFKEYIKNGLTNIQLLGIFFHTMDNASGEDLTWFWKGWFVENYKLDQAIVDVKMIL